MLLPLLKLFLFLSLPLSSLPLSLRSCRCCRSCCCAAAWPQLATNRHPWHATAASSMSAAPDAAASNAHPRQRGGKTRRRRGSKQRRHAPPQAATAAQHTPARNLTQTCLSIERIWLSSAHRCSSCHSHYHCSSPRTAAPPRFWLPMDPLCPAVALLGPHPVSIPAGCCRLERDVAHSLHRAAMSVLLAASLQNALTLPLSHQQSFTSWFFINRRGFFR